MKISIFLLSLFIVSCSQKAINYEPLEIDEKNLLTQKFSELKKIYPSIEPEEYSTINSKTYAVYSIKNENAYTLQFLVDERLNSIVEATKLDFKNPVFPKDDRKYSLTYQPKCASKSTSIKYDLERKTIAVIKNNQILLEGSSNIILDRLETDKNQKCLNSWGH